MSAVKKITGSETWIVMPVEFPLSDGSETWVAKSVEFSPGNIRIYETWIVIAGEFPKQL